MNTDQASAPVVAAPALRFDGGIPVIHGIATLAGLVPQDAAVFVGLEWVIEEELYPLNRTTGRAAVDGDPGTFALSPGQPLAEALVANEATNRPGVGVAYLTAFVDADGDGILRLRGRQLRGLSGGQFAQHPGGLRRGSLACRR